MVKILKGNILNSTEDIICHQCNVQGSMGGGVARQLANRYLGLEKEYSEYCKCLDNDYKHLKGKVFFCGVSDNKTICNMFSQKENFDTDYEAMKKALTYIKKWAENNNLSICMPYGIGCGIANGNWEKVYKIIEEVFSDYDVTLYKLEDKQNV